MSDVLLNAVMQSKKMQCNQVSASQPSPARRLKGRPKTSKTN
jgi:hypothetical protein